MGFGFIAEPDKTTYKGYGENDNIDQEEHDKFGR